ncbi:MAG: radical SAM protein [Candidatus Krumholzibacteria bacterium]
MRLLLINPSNRLSGMVNLKQNRWNKYRVWKPLGLMTLAGLTPLEWDVTVVDENLGIPDYAGMPCPDLVGITAFTSQAPRAYDLATEFRSRGVPVVMGGIHATMCSAEALDHVDTVVKGEAESVWTQVLEDVRRGALEQIYEGSHVEMEQVPFARHDLLQDGYLLGSIQTARGCPLNCIFCSVSAFNGRKYRRRSVENVMREFKMIRESRVLIVDDNLIGTRKDHIVGAKDLFRALIRANLGKTWIAQVTINMADDEELLRLAAKAGCDGVFIGFETPSPEGLAEIRKKFNSHKDRDFRASVRRIQRHGIVVAGSFIVGLDVDKPGIGGRIAAAATHYGLDVLNVHCLTPLPGTDLWDKMESEGRIAANAFPEDWKYYTLTFPVGHYKHLNRDDICREMDSCNRQFYSLRRILSRVVGSVLERRKPLFTIVANLSNRNSMRTHRKAFREFAVSQGARPALNTIRGNTAMMAAATEVAPE